MEEKHHFVITRYCPTEEIFDGMMTFTEARRFMDLHASYERRVSFKVFNERLNRWELFRDTSYHGGRKVYDKGELYILDPDYRGMWKPESQAWHLWYVKPDGTRMFMQSFATKESANKRRDFLFAYWKDGTYIVEPSDIKFT